MARKHKFEETRPQDGNRPAHVFSGTNETFSQSAAEGPSSNFLTSCGGTYSICHQRVGHEQWCLFDSQRDTNKTEVNIWLDAALTSPGIETNPLIRSSRPICPHLSTGAFQGPGTALALDEDEEEQESVASGPPELSVGSVGVINRN